MNEEKTSNYETPLLRRTEQYSDIVRDVLKAYEDHPGAVNPKEVVALYGTIAKLGVGARRIHGVLADLRRERRPPDAAQFDAFYRYFDLVDELDGILQRLNIAILDVYKPGLAAHFADVKSTDYDVYFWFDRVIAPKFGITQRNLREMPTSLKRVLGDWSHGARPRFTLRNMLDSRHSDHLATKMPTEADMRTLEILSKDMQSLADEVGGLIRENWSLGEIAEAGKPTLRVQVGDYFSNIGRDAVVVNRSSLANELNGVQANKYDEAACALKSVATEAEKSSIGRVAMGDTFSNIEHSTIINRSLVKEAFNKVRSETDEETAEVLLEVMEAVAKSGDKEAGEIMDQFNEELAKPAPRKSLLKRSWDNLVQVLPGVTAIAGAAGAVAKLFT